MGDAFGGRWPRDAFGKRSIRYIPCKRPKSDLYVDLLPLLHSGQIVLPDNNRLRNQLCGLERKVTRSGRDSIDHGPQPNCHDDLANVCAGAAYAVSNVGFPPRVGRY
jgi:hypothetical protein